MSADRAVGAETALPVVPRPARNWHKRIWIWAVCSVLGLMLIYAAWYGSINGRLWSTQITTLPTSIAGPEITTSYIPTPASTASATLARTVAVTSTPTETLAPTVTPHPRAYSPPTRIRIPKINVDADVVEVGYEIKEENGETLTVWKVADYAAGFHRGSAYPGHPGNTVIAGHNNIRGRVFRHLLDLLPGDDIYLYVGEQEFHYVVGQRLLIKEKGMSEEIQRENAKWIQPTDDERLTLVSCWPFIKPDHRVIVIAWPK